jgi:HEPN domain-containing protein
MTNWAKDTLRALDLKYAEQGVHLHQRPFRAAVDILGPAFSMGVGGNPEVQKIMAAYAEMIPEVDANWPGMGIGLAAVVDQVRRVVVPVVMGGPGSIEVWQGLGFPDDKAWWLWCRENEDHSARTSFAFADLHDLTYGLDDMRGGSGAELTLWKMATSNLADAANNLPTAFSVDSVLQPICMTAELSIKAALVRNGANPTSFKGKDGHDLKKLVDRLATETPHRDDALTRDVVAHLPPYVDSRYAPAGLTRLEVVGLAIGVQFLAASTVRRFSDRDIAAQMETGGWPAPRRPFFAS